MAGGSRGGGEAGGRARANSSQSHPSQSRGGRSRGAGRGKRGSYHPAGSRANAAGTATGNAAAGVAGGNATGMTAGSALGGPAGGDSASAAAAAALVEAECKQKELEAAQVERDRVRREQMQREKEAAEREAEAAAESRRAEQAREEAAARARAEEAARRAVEDEARAREAAVRRGREILSARAADAREFASCRAPRTAPGSTHLDASIKKIHAFLRRVATRLGEADGPRIVEEYAALDFARFVSELASAVAEARLASVADADAALRLCVAAHMDHREFAQILVAQLRKSFAAPVAASPPADRAGLLSQRRGALRLLARMLIVGVSDDIAAARAIMERILDQEREALAANRPFEHFGIVLVASFAKQAAVPLLRIDVGEDAACVRSFVETCAEEAAELERAAVAPSFPDSECAALRSAVEAYFHWAVQRLVDEHAALRALEQEHHRAIGERGTLRDDEVKAGEEKRRQVQKLATLLTSFAEILGTELPQLPSGAAPGSVSDSAVLCVVDASPGAVGGSAQPTASSGPQIPLWASEEEHAFYEVLPPWASPPLAATAAAPAAASTAAISGSPPIAAAGAPADVDADALADYSAESLRSAPAGEDEDAEDDASVATASASSATSGSTNAPAKPRTVKLSKLASMRYVHDADNFTHSFVEASGKAANYKKLTQQLYQAPRTKRQLLALYARVAATLHRRCRSMVPALVGALESDLKELLPDLRPESFAQKLFTVNYLNELVKFRLHPGNMHLNLLRKLLDEFQFQNVELACVLLDGCGRFLLLSPETQLRARNLFDVMVRLRKTRNLGERYESMIDHTLHSVLPPVRSARVTPKSRSPMEMFARDLVRRQLSSATVREVVHEIRCFAWADYRLVFLHLFLSAHKLRYSQMRAAASAVAGIGAMRPGFASDTVDLLIERVRDGIEAPAFQLSQRRVAEVRLLGELAVAGLVDVGVVHTVVRLLLPSAPTDSSAAAAVAAAAKADADVSGRAADRQPKHDDEELFRLRLSCVLCAAASVCFRSSPADLVQFQSTLFTVQREALRLEPLPVELRFLLEDLVAPHALPTSFEALVAIERQFAEPVVRARANPVPSAPRDTDAAIEAAARLLSSASDAVAVALAEAAGEPEEDAECARGGRSDPLSADAFDTQLEMMMRGGFESRRGDVRSVALSAAEQAALRVSVPSSEPAPDAASTGPSSTTAFRVVLRKPAASGAASPAGGFKVLVPRSDVLAVSTEQRMQERRDEQERVRQHTLLAATRSMPAAPVVTGTELPVADYAVPSTWASSGTPSR